jgi:hypothetical protein
VGGFDGVILTAYLREGCGGRVKLGRPGQQRDQRVDYPVL